MLASNDDWETNAIGAELRFATTAVGAFPFAAGGRDAALLITLLPGPW